MTDTKGLQKLKDHFQRLESSRQELQRRSGDAQRLSKQTIFALQRHDVKQSAAALAEAERELGLAAKIVSRESRLASEGMWRSSLEEYCEALFCDRIARQEPLFPVPALVEDPDIQLGALSDAVGEAARMVIAAATVHDDKEVNRLHAIAESIVQFLTSLNLTGSLRSKGDQARQHLRKIEDVRYDLSRAR